MSVALQRPAPEVGTTLWRMHWRLVNPAEPRGERVPEPLACLITAIRGLRYHRTSVEWTEASRVEGGRVTQRHAWLTGPGWWLPEQRDAQDPAIVAYHPPTGSKLYATPAAALAQARREAEDRAERAARDCAQAARQVEAINAALAALPDGLADAVPRKGGRPWWAAHLPPGRPGPEPPLRTARLGPPGLNITEVDR